MNIILVTTIAYLLSVALTYPIIKRTVFYPIIDNIYITSLFSRAEILKIIAFFPIINIVWVIGDIKYRLLFWRMIFILNRNKRKLTDEAMIASNIRAATAIRNFLSDPEIFTAEKTDAILNEERAFLSKRGTEIRGQKILQNLERIKQRISEEDIKIRFWLKDIGFVFISAQSDNKEQCRFCRRHYCRMYAKESWCKR